MKCIRLAVLTTLTTTLLLAEPEKVLAPAPKEDRVGLPKGYAETYEVLRTVNHEEELKVVTVYGNKPAASITEAAQLPYPFGSIIVMETAKVVADKSGKAQADDQGNLRKGKVTGIHVMRREKDFGAAYGPARSGEWEYVEYDAKGSYITPPAKSAACAECHIKAGTARDFVFRGRLPADDEESE